MTNQMLLANDYSCNFESGLLREALKLGKGVTADKIIKSAGMHKS